MAKVVWIVNYYTATPEKVSNPRYLQMAHYFMKGGYKVITFNHTFKGEKIFQRRQYGEYDFVHVKSPCYVGNGLKRMYSIWKFAQTLNNHCKEFEKPDIVLQNIHPPFDYPIVKMTKRLEAKYIAEAWDLWPDNFAVYGLMSRNNPIMKVAYQIEKYYYYAADEIVFTFKGAFDYLKNKGWTTETGGKIDMDHVHYINNGIDLEQFDKDVMAHPRKDADLNDPDTYKIIYLGSINLSNNVKTLIEDAKQLQNIPKYRFIFYGDGAQREQLEQQVKQQEIKNVVFKEKWIPLAECAWIVSQATVNVMNYSKGFAYMGVSAGKLFQYLAAGKPIVCNVKISYDDIITDNNLGVARDLITAEEFVTEIRRIAEQSQELYDEMCKRVREVATHFDYKVLAKRELELLR